MMPLQTKNKSMPEQRNRATSHTQDVGGRSLPLILTTQRCSKMRQSESISPWGKQAPKRLITYSQRKQQQLLLHAERLQTQPRVQINRQTCLSSRRPTTQAITTSAPSPLSSEP